MSKQLDINKFKALRYGTANISNVLGNKTGLIPITINEAISMDPSRRRFLIPIFPRSRIISDPNFVEVTEIKPPNGSETKTSEGKTIKEALDKMLQDIMSEKSM